MSIAKYRAWIEISDIVKLAPRIMHFLVNTTTQWFWHYYSQCLLQRFKMPSPTPTLAYLLRETKFGKEVKSDMKGYKISFSPVISDAFVHLKIACCWADDGFIFKSLWTFERLNGLCLSFNFDWISSKTAIITCRNSLKMRPDHPFFKHPLSVVFQDTN